MRRNAAATTAALMAAVVVFWAATLPPAAAHAVGAPDPLLQARTLAGAFHVHSTLSDGSATRLAIADAAARAGLQFVVFTDHGDATREPEAPTYRGGVLCLDAVEISTNGGHYIAVGLPAAPYRLGGEPSTVVEDVRRLGGFGVVAHPDSSKQALAWSDWGLDVDGVEWLNADSEWRNKSAAVLARRLLDYFVRPAPVLASMLERPTATLGRWDRATMGRRVVGLAGHDAHGGAGDEAGGPLWSHAAGVPSYEASFRSFALRVLLAKAPTGNAGQDGAMVVAALRSGRAYTVIDGRGAPGWLEMSAERQGAVAGPGESVGGHGAVTFRMRAARTGDSVIRLLHNGAAVAEAENGEVTAVVAAPGSYRAEVSMGNRAGAAPWILGNPIYVDLPSAAASASQPSLREVLRVPAERWRIEKDPSSQAELDRVGETVGLRYRLRSGPEVSQYVALAADLPTEVASFTGVLLEVASGTPLRLSLQLRSLEGEQRWGRSVYVSPQGAPLLVRLGELLPLTAPARGVEAGDRARSVLLVIDLVNALPGSRGEVVLRRLSLAHLP